MNKLEPLLITYWDDRAELNKVSVEACVADWSDNGEFIEFDSRAVLDKNEAKQIAEWLLKWVNE